MSVQFIKDSVTTMWRFLFLGLVFLSSVVVAGGSRTLNEGFRPKESACAKGKLICADGNVDLRLPTDQHSVIQALVFALNLKGYLVDLDFEQHPEQYVLFSLNVPENFNNRRYSSLDKVLQALIGQAFQYRVNPVTREVVFFLKKRYQDYLNEKDIERAKKAWESKKQLGAYKNLLSREATVFGYGPIKKGETLGGVLGKIPLNGLSIEQAMVQVFKANTPSFIGGNMNQLRVGSTLTIGPLDMGASPDRNQAKKIVLAHYQRWIEARVEK
ncbi:hypothetical protein [uncultured Pseudoteredinibacter sp.]|uniref:hypothetical protein n=1 Tax=uncultured Pseudoteredinibacter sp. TaxID=1641701 RepID=UPI00260F23C5|nr:hypothetical protein [uncultured Pseudoteredinibacter sp.]